MCVCVCVRMFVFARDLRMCCFGLVAVTGYGKELMLFRSWRWPGCYVGIATSLFSLSLALSLALGLAFLCLQCVFLVRVDRAFAFAHGNTYLSQFVFASMHLYRYMCMYVLLLQYITTCLPYMCLRATCPCASACFSLVCVCGSCAVSTVCVLCAGVRLNLLVCANACTCARTSIYACARACVCFCTFVYASHKYFYV